MFYSYFSILDSVRASTEPINNLGSSIIMPVLIVIIVLLTLIQRNSLALFNNSCLQIKNDIPILFFLRDPQLSR